MEGLLVRLTKDQIRFLEKHGIPLSEAFDATGYSRASYSERMRELGKVVAYGVTRCKKSRHSLRSRHGTCIQCFPASIAYARRAYLPGFVYIAQSHINRSLKIGFSGDDPDNRIYIANLEGYGDAWDWRIRRLVWSERAGKIEAATHQELAAYRSDEEWIRNGTLIRTRELFSCSLATASRALVRNLVPDEIARVEKRRL
jgi:predicted GIY-YIG superfamily endonuclease